MNDRYVNGEQLARELHICSRTVRRWRHRGLLPFRINGATYEYHLETARATLASMPHKTTRHRGKNR